jgi:hypothetical protein
MSSQSKFFSQTFKDNVHSGAIVQLTHPLLQNFLLELEQLA